MSNRFGKFYVSNPMVDDDNYGLASILVMMGFIPTRVEQLWHRREFEYIGLSPMFRKMKEGEIVPEYVITPHTGSDGLVDSVDVSEITDA